MAGLAEGHKVVLAVGTTMTERQDVVYFLSRSYTSFLHALLAQWVGGDISVAYSFPRSAVAFMYSRVAVVLFVAFRLLFSMLLAEPAICQLWAARVRAGALGFVGQRAHLDSGYKESPARLFPRGSPDSIFLL